jgi:hypothetical protein
MGRMAEKWEETRKEREEAEDDWQEVLKADPAYLKWLQEQEQDRGHEQCQGNQRSVDPNSRQLKSALLCCRNQIWVQGLERS